MRPWMVLRSVAIAATLLLVAAPAYAQQPDTAAARRAAEAQLGRSLSQAEIMERIRESGLSRSEAKMRLRQLGYDPSIVDPYYDAMEAEGAGAGGRTSRDADQFLRELAELNRPRAAPAVDTAIEPTDTAEPRRRQAVGGVGGSDGELPRFGRDLFDRSTTEFEPVQQGPVDRGYRLGPGDEIQLILTGGVEAAYSLPVGRQGQIVIPDVGQIAVAGMTMEQLDTALRHHLGRVYAGVRGPEPTIRFQAALGSLRTNQVYIVGEVERPGAYQVGGVATVFHALYRAGGPNESGSFRQVQVWRGDRVVRTIDLYDYLMGGDSRDDIRLENGDRIHVPLSGPQVEARGALRRPARYELVPGEDLRDLLRYAGGFTADALVRRVQVDRILPPQERMEGDRALLDIDVVALLEGRASTVPLRDGDIVEVFGISSERRNRVAVRGEVRRPGTYEWWPGATLGDLIDRADGLNDVAYTDRAHIFRLEPATGDRRLVSVPLDDGAGRIVALADRDSVVIHSRDELRTPEVVHIDGFVKGPGTYELADGTTVQDLLLMAGGFTEGAHTLDAEVARPPDPTSRTDTTAHVLRVALDDARFPLRHGDRVFVRKAPAFDDDRTVTVRGEVAFPGDYVLARRQERLTDVLARAGGFTSEVYVPGIRIVREGRLVAVDAARALRNPDGPLNLVLQAGDSVAVPRYDPTVLVQGAVNFESRVLYRPGASLEYYIERAGGYRDAAARDRVSVTQQNGERNTMRSVLMMRRAPSVAPGSTIYVPELPPSERDGISLDSFLARSMSVASVAATLLLAISQLR